MRMPPIDGHRPHRGIGENETPRSFTSPHDLGDDGFEIMAVGAQAMQPDDGCVGFGCGFYFDGFQHAGNVLGNAGRFEAFLLARREARPGSARLAVMPGLVRRDARSG